MSMQYAKEKMPNTGRCSKGTVVSLPTTSVTFGVVVCETFLVVKVVQLVSTMSAVEDDFLIAPRQISRHVISDGEKVAAEKMIEAKRMTMKKNALLKSPRCSWRKKIALPRSA